MPAHRTEGDRLSRLGGEQLPALLDAAAPARPLEARDGPTIPVPASRRPRVAWWGPAATVLVATVVAAGALAMISHSLFTRNEQRLLRLRVREAASLIASSLPDLQTPLASAAELADATGGEVAKFRRFAAGYVGATKSLVSLSLWRRGAIASGPLTVVGARPKLLTASGQAPAFFARTAGGGRLSVIGLLAPPGARLGYGYAVPGSRGGYIAYGESALPRTRRSRYQSSSAFSELDYAIYLGSAQRPSRLLVSDVARLPFTGRHYAQRIPFGDNLLTLVMSPRGPLSGSLPQRLPLLVSVVGVLLALGAATLSLRLGQRRRAAERLTGELELVAAENRRLYAEQRGIAQTLQHALLPEALPEAPGIESSARYDAGEEGLEIGGDWYDLIEQGEGRMLLVVGDVSGRGLRAATTMASLRYAIRAYAAQADPPAAILTKLSSLVSVAEDGQLATVLLLLVDRSRAQLQLTSAGHLPPLLIADGSSRYLDCEVGLPIGVDVSAAYATRTVPAPGAGTVLAFTDGLVERRGESLDEGLARLRDAARADHGSVSELLGRLVEELRATHGDDDTAIVGVRWTS